ncbi:MAG: response regulator [Anaerolineales bacterium]
MRILLASGDTDLRLAIQLMLSEEPGITIIGSASDCKGLIALIKSTSPDLVLLDWELPGSNMEAVLLDIKTFASQPKINLIVLGRQPSMRQAALQAGADEYVVIGDPPDVLLETFRQLNIL